MNRWLCGLVAIVASLAWPLAPAFAGGTVISDAQLHQLLEAVCRTPPRLRGSSGRPFLACDWPRDYPEHVNQMCPIAVDTTSDGRTKIYYGRFTAPVPQAITSYLAFCEPHAHDYGGIGLFEVVGGGFKLLQWLPGQRAVDCAVPSTSDNSLQTAYCFDSDLRSGDLTYGFGPLKFSNGKARIDDWVGAHNLDSSSALIAPMTECGPSGPSIHHFVSVQADEAGQIVLEAARLAPAGYEAACKRFRASDFSDAERQSRREPFVPLDMAFIRSDENKYVKLILRFRPPNRTPDIETTSIQVAQ